MPDVAEVPAIGTGVKAGWRPEFTPVEDLIIVREVSASKAHIAPYAEIGDRFNTPSDKSNDNPQMSKKLTAKSLQDRYKKLQDQFHVYDTKHRVIGGVGGDIDELDELLGGIAEAGKDTEDTKCAEKAAKRPSEDERVRIGKALIDQSLRRSCTGAARNSEDGDDADGGNEEVVGWERKRRRTSLRPAAGASGE